VHRPHHADHSAIALVVGLLIVGCGVAGCNGGALPRPSYVQVRAEDYVAVPFVPRPPPVEVVPPRPSAPAQGGQGGLVWADGGWTWAGDRYRWEPGAWVAPPDGARRARWVLVRRELDGQLFFAPSSWRDQAGRPIAPKPLSRASTRPSGAGASETAAPPPRSDLDE
jgi:hypothetical protein